MHAVIPLLHVVIPLRHPVIPLPRPAIPFTRSVIPLLRAVIPLTGRVIPLRDTVIPFTRLPIPARDFQPDDCQGPNPNQSQFSCVKSLFIILAMDYIPQGDAPFDTWQDNFVAKVGASPVDYGLVAGDMIPVTAAQTAWQTDYPAHVSAQAAAEAAAATKTNSRNSFVAAIRVVVNKIQGAGVASDGDKENAGIRVRDTTRTPVNAPTTRPVGQIDTGQRFKHTVSFRDELTPTSIAKPGGVRACQLFVKIGGAAPVDASECTYIATDTKSPYTYTFEGEDANQIAHWMLRWESTRGETGPWSETISATIPG